MDAKIQAGKFVLKRASQNLYPLELSCDLYPSQEAGKAVLNPDAREFRPIRRAAVSAAEAVKITLQEEEESYL